MDLGGAWERVAAARVARLATIGADGLPDLVPVTFALIGAGAAVDPASARLVVAVDHKPKTTLRLQRLDNVRARPDVSVLVDHYDDDWSTLWWIRFHGRGRVLESPNDLPPGALDALVAKYRPYADVRPAGPVIDIEITRWQWWSAADGAGHSTPSDRDPP